MGLGRAVAQSRRARAAFFGTKLHSLRVLGAELIHSRQECTRGCERRPDEHHCQGHRFVAQQLFGKFQRQTIRASTANGCDNTFAHGLPRRARERLREAVVDEQRNRRWAVSKHLTHGSAKGILPQHGTVQPKHDVVRALAACDLANVGCGIG